MATNFPAALDTAVQLGGAFADTIPTVDPIHQIAAAYRVNLNDAMFATQLRIGINDSLDPTSLTWATLGVGGVQNQGLQFSQANVQWPGDFSYAGIFLDVATGLPAFHRAGDPANVFTPTYIDLQNAYNNGNVIITAGGNPVEIQGTENFVYTGTNDINFTFAATKHLHIDATTTANTNANGALFVDYEPGANNVQGVLVSVANTANGRTGFGGVASSMLNDGTLADTNVVYGYKSTMRQDGNGPGGGYAIVADYYAATPTIGGGGNFVTSALFSATGHPYGVFSDHSTVGFYSLHNTTALMVDSETSNYIYSDVGNATVKFNARTGETTLFDAKTAAEPLRGRTSADGCVKLLWGSGAKAAVGMHVHTFNTDHADSAKTGGVGLYLHNTSRIADGAAALLGAGAFRGCFTIMEGDDTDDATANIYAFQCDVAKPSTNTGAGMYGFHAVVPEVKVGGIYHTNDSTFATPRWAFYASSGESNFRRTLFEGPNDLAKALVHINQADVDQPFICVEGTYAANPEDGNLAQSPGGAVVGPGDTNWDYYGMFKVYLKDASHTLTDGVYYVPLYAHHH